MKILTSVAASMCARLTTVAAAAQGGTGSAAAPSPSPPAAAPTPSPTPVTACRGGADPGIDDVDAATATQLVCSELARAGAPAGAHDRQALLDESAVEPGQRRHVRHRRQRHEVERAQQVRLGPLRAEEPACFAKSFFSTR